jgi:hypothetical protein
MNNTYTLRPFTGVLNHTWSKARLVRDGDERIYPLEAQVHSGDYFVTLAMKLDTLATSTEDARIKATLEDIVSDLIHLQDNYAIIKSDRELETNGYTNRTQENI